MRQEGGEGLPCTLLRLLDVDEPASFLRAQRGNVEWTDSEQTVDGTRSDCVLKWGPVQTGGRLRVRVGAVARIFIPVHPHAKENIGGC